MFDPKCLDLAEYFGEQDERARELAERIQETVEDFINEQERRYDHLIESHYG